MKTALITAIALMATSQAFAADLPVPVKAPQVRSLDVSGFYVGPTMFGAGGVDTVNTIIPGQKTSVAGGGGGMVFGYHSWSSTRYLGFEVDGNKTNIGGNVLCDPNPTCSLNTQWSVGARAMYSTPGLANLFTNLSSVLSGTTPTPTNAAPGTVPYLLAGIRADDLKTTVAATQASKWHIKPVVGMGMMVPRGNEQYFKMWTEMEISTGKTVLAPNAILANDTKVLVGMSMIGSFERGMLSGLF